MQVHHRRQGWQAQELPTIFQGPWQGAVFPSWLQEFVGRWCAIARSPALFVKACEEVATHLETHPFWFI